jgi:hypothetical protein
MAVVDKKKGSILDYLKQYQPNVPLVALNGGSSISSESLKGLLVKIRCGYGNRNTMMIKSTIAAMLSAMSNLSSATSNFRA